MPEVVCVSFCWNLECGTLTVDNGDIMKTNCERLLAENIIIIYKKPWSFKFDLGIKFRLSVMSSNR